MTEGTANPEQTDGTVEPLPPAPATKAPDSPAPLSVRDLRQNRTVVLGLLLGAMILSLQLLLLLWHSRRQYQHFNLSIDFAIFHQAWFQIAHGHLSPMITVNPVAPHPTPYWRSHFELIMWPLALAYWLWPNDGLTLLVVQDLSIVTAEFVMLWWIVRVAHVRRTPPVLAASTVVAAALLGAANPWLYSGAQQDFHFEATATCFALAAGYQLWSGRRTMCWVFVALTLLCGDVAGTYLIGIGLAMAIALRPVRRRALAVAAAGLGWVVLIALLGADRGTPIDQYWYLAGHLITGGAAGVAAVARGSVTHPSRPLSRLVGSREEILRLLQPSGLIGLVNPWLWAPIVVVLMENVLNISDQFREPEFQNFPVYILATTGTGLLVILVAGRTRNRQALAAVVLVVSLGSSLVFDIGRHEYGIYRAPMEAGAELQAIRARIPADAEVISSFGVMGRFAGRRSIHSFVTGGNVIPLDRPTVVMVLTRGVGNDPTPAAVVDQLQGMATGRYHARTVEVGTYASAYEWTRRSGDYALRVP